MANEIIIKVNNELGNSKLGRVTAAIIKSLNTDIRNEKDRALKIAQVNEEEMYKPAGFETCAEWAEKFFGFEKTKVSRYISIVRDFKDMQDDTGAGVWDIFSISQLIACLSLKGDYAPIIDGRITPDMTVKEIREAVNVIKSLVDIPDEPTGTDEPTETESDEPETVEAEEVATLTGESAFKDFTKALNKFINTYKLNPDTVIKFNITLS